MADAQKTLTALRLLGVVNSSEIAAASDIADEPASTALVGAGEEAGAKVAVTEGLDATGTLVGIDGLGAALGPIGLTGVVAKQVYDQAEGHLEAETQESEKQDAGNEALYNSTQDTLSVGNTRAVETVKEFDLGLKQAGYQENATPGKAGDATSVDNLKTAADKAIHEALGGEDMDTLLTRALERSKKDGEAGGPLQSAREDATARLAAAKAQPDDEVTEDGYSVHNYHKDQDTRAAQDELATAQKNIALNEEQIKAQEKKLDHSTDETAEARVRMNAAEDAVKAALRDATARPAVPGSNPAGQPEPAWQTEILQQLLKQQNSANQMLTSLLDANRQSGGKQAGLLQQLVANEARMQDEIDRLRAQLVNLYSVGMH